MMEQVDAYLPLSFFHELLPFNLQLIDGNAMVLRAIGVGSGGEPLRSKEFILFGNGLATLVFEERGYFVTMPGGFAMTVVGKEDVRGVRYWEVQSRIQQDPRPSLSFHVSDCRPSDCGGVMSLIGQEGEPGQWIYLV